MAVTFANTLFAVWQFRGITLSGNVAATNRAGKVDVWLSGTVATALPLLRHLSVELAPIGPWVG